MTAGYYAVPERGALNGSRATAPTVRQQHSLHTHVPQTVSRYGAERKLRQSACQIHTREARIGNL